MTMSFRAAALPGERRIDGGEHVFGHDVCQKPESASVDAEQRCAARGDEACTIEQRAIASDGDHQIDGRELRFRHEARAQSGQTLGLIFEGKHRDAAGSEVVGELRGALGDPRIGKTGDEGTEADVAHGAPGKTSRGFIMPT
jgi:hypothetical protein